MRGMTETMTIGERVAFYRRRRGMAQVVLAGLVGRTEDWLSKVENNRIELDRLSVIRSLAEALDVALADLVVEPTLLDWTTDSGVRTVPALRAVLMDYGQMTPALAVVTASAGGPRRACSARSARCSTPTRRPGTPTSPAGPRSSSPTLCALHVLPAPTTATAPTLCSRWPTRRRCRC